MNNFEAFFKVQFDNSQAVNILQVAVSFNALRNVENEGKRQTQTNIIVLFTGITIL